MNCSASGFRGFETPCPPTNFEILDRIGKVAIEWRLVKKTFRNLNQRGIAWNIDLSQWAGPEGTFNTSSGEWSRSHPVTLKGKKKVRIKRIRRYAKIKIIVHFPHIDDPSHGLYKHQGSKKTYYFN